MKKIILASFLSFSMAWADHDGVDLHGFLDAGAYSNATESEFSLGVVDLFLSKRISPKVTVLVELIFETLNNELIMDLERAQISYEVSEALTTIFGRFHLPYGYWNTAYHHGATVQTSILRPKFIDFEDAGGILPTHGVGVWANGNIGNISYDIYTTNDTAILNSPDSNSTVLNTGELVTSTSGDGDSHVQSGFNLAYNTENSKIGVHGLSQTIGIYGDRSSNILMYGAYAYYEGDNLEVVTESYFFNNRNNTGINSGQRYNSSAFFIQASYDWDDYVPYLRLETANLAKDDVYFLSQEGTIGGSYNRVALGMKTDVDGNAVLKFSYVLTDESGLSQSYQVLTQLSVYF